jgi:hypothetical protein
MGAFVRLAKPLHSAAGTTLLKPQRLTLFSGVNSTCVGEQNKNRANHIDDSIKINQLPCCS